MVKTMRVCAIDDRRREIRLAPSEAHCVSCHRDRCVHRRVRLLRGSYDENLAEGDIVTVTTDARATARGFLCVFAIPTLGAITATILGRGLMSVEILGLVGAVTGSILGLWIGSRTQDRLRVVARLATANRGLVEFADRESPDSRTGGKMSPQVGF